MPSPLSERSVGILKLVGSRWVRAQMIMPVAATFAVATTTFTLAEQGWVDADLRAMIAPLVTFLPGAAVTMGVVELSAAQLVTGASRLVAAALQRVRLAFGIVGASWLGTQADKHQTEPESNRPDGP